jgi:hypothetical protein
VLRATQVWWKSKRNRIASSFSPRMRYPGIVFSSPMSNVDPDRP